MKGRLKMALFFPLFQQFCINETMASSTVSVTMCVPKERPPCGATNSPALYKWWHYKWLTLVLAVGSKWPWCTFTLRFYMYRLHDHDQHCIVKYQSSQVSVIAYNYTLQNTTQFPHKHIWLKNIMQAVVFSIALFFGSPNISCMCSQCGMWWSWGCQYCGS